MPDPPRRLSRGALLDWAVGAAVLLPVGLVQLAVLQGPRPHDPAIYLRSAAAFPDVAPNLFTLRIGLVAPVHAAIRLFGESEAALYTVPFAAILLLAAAVYGTTLVLVRDRVVASAAALVAALNAYYLFNSSFLFPDTLATATFTAGFFFLVYAGTLAAERGAAWTPALAAGAAGALFGWTYLVREFSPILLPAVVVAVVLLRYPLRLVATLAGAAVATFLLEVLYGFVRYGEPFLHVRSLVARRETPVGRARAASVEHVQEQLDSLLDTVLVFPRLLVTWSVGWVFLALVAVFAVGLVRLRDRRLWLLAAWCFGFWAIMAVLGLGSLPSGRWIVNVTNVRYWYPIFPPLVMGAFAGVTLLVRQWGTGRRGVAVTYAVTAALAALALLPGLVQYRRCADAGAWIADPRERWHDLRSWLATPEAGRYDVVWTDRNTARYVPVFATGPFGEPLWDGRAERIGRSPDVSGRADGLQRVLVLVSKDRFRSQRWLDDLRREWSPVFVSDDGMMVALAHESSSPRRTAAAGEWWKAEGDRGDTRRCRLRPYAPGG